MSTSWSTHCEIRNVQLPLSIKQLLKILIFPPSNSCSLNSERLFYMSLWSLSTFLGPLSGKKLEVTFAQLILHFFRTKPYCTITVYKCFTSSVSVICTNTAFRSNFSHACIFCCLQGCVFNLTYICDLPVILIPFPKAEISMDLVWHTEPPPCLQKLS